MGNVRVVKKEIIGKKKNLAVKDHTKCGTWLRYEGSHGCVGALETMTAPSSGLFLP